MGPISNTALMVDISISLRGGVKPTQKIIYGANNSGFLLTVKKLLWGKKMRDGAKKYINELCIQINKNKRNEKIETLLQKINTNTRGKIPVDVDELDVINAFSPLVKDELFWKEISGIPIQSALSSDLRQLVLDAINKKFTDTAQALTPKQFKSTIKNLGKNEEFKKHIDINFFDSPFHLLKKYLENSSEINTPESAEKLLDFLKKLKNFFDGKSSPNVQMLKININQLIIEITHLSEKLAELIKHEIVENSNENLLFQERKDGEDLKERTSNRQTRASSKNTAEHRSKILNPSLKNSIITASRNPVFLGQTQDKKDASAQMAFRNFIKNPDNFSGLNSNNENLKHFIDFFLKNIYSLPEKERSHCLDGADRLLGFLQSKKNEGIFLINAQDEDYREFSEIISVLRMHSDPAHPSGFLMLLIDYLADKGIDKLKFHALSHLMSDEALLKSIMAQLSDAQKSKFEQSLKNLEVDLKVFKDTEGEATWKSINATRLKHGLIPESEFDRLTEPHSLATLEKVAEAKKLSTIKTALLKFQNLDFYSKNALAAFTQFLKDQEPNLNINDNATKLENFSTLFFNNILLLNSDERKACMNKIDLLRGDLLQHKDPAMQKIDIKSSIFPELDQVIKDWKFDMEHGFDPSGFFIDMANYMNIGDSSIDSTTYWTLSHLVEHQAKGIEGKLAKEDKPHFSTMIAQLQADLENFRRKNNVA